MSYKWRLGVAWPDFSLIFSGAEKQASRSIYAWCTHVTFESRFSNAKRKKAKESWTLLLLLRSKYRRRSRVDVCADSESQRKPGSPYHLFAQPAAVWQFAFGGVWLSFFIDKPCGIRGYFLSGAVDWPKLECLGDFHKIVSRILSVSRCVVPVFTSCSQINTFGRVLSARRIYCLTQVQTGQPFAGKCSSNCVIFLVRPRRNLFTLIRVKRVEYFFIFSTPKLQRSWHFFSCHFTRLEGLDLSEEEQRH